MEIINNSNIYQVKTDNSEIFGVKFYEYFQSQKFCDVLISAESKTIQAHKLILSAASPYFEHLFDQHIQGRPAQMIVLTEVAFEDLVDILELIYKGETHIKEENKDRFFKAASFFHLKGFPSPQHDAAVSSMSTPLSLLPEIVEDPLKDDLLKEGLRRNPKRKAQEPTTNASDDEKPEKKSVKKEKQEDVKPKLNCQFCNKYVARLKVHELDCKLNPGRTIHQCSECQKVLSRADKLVEHMKTH